MAGPAYFTDIPTLFCFTDTVKFLLSKKEILQTID
jgi:hypothetical protein